jgi:SAM-dependent methyltransferase
MKALFYLRNSCRLCGEKSLDPVIDLVPTPPGDHYLPADQAGPQEAYPLDLVFCRDCGLLQLSAVVDPAILYGNYLYATSISLGLAEHFQRCADEILRRIRPAAGALVVDIGSNDGTLLQCYQKRGLRVLGIDPAGEVARKATAAGIETLHAFFSPELARSIRREQGAATIITANNVMANIDDLGSLIEGIRGLLSPNGVFIFETGYMPDLIGKTILDNIYHEHLSYFSATPLAAFFRRNGLELFDVERIPTKGGSLRGYVQLAHGPHPLSPSVTAMLDDESRLGFTCRNAFLPFSEKLESVKANLAGMILDMKAQGKSVAGYGASVGVTTLIYYLGLGQVLDYLIDDNPVRHGLVSPGFHLPIVASSAIYERRPDWILILAWQYAGPIMGKHAQYRDHGGRFLVPLPTLSVT